MKSLLSLFFMCTLFLVSCKKEEQQKEQQEEQHNKLTESSINQLEGFEVLTTLSGEFIYYGSQAVLKNKNMVYGVIMNEKAEELIQKAKEIDPDPYTSFEVTLEAVYKEIDNKDRWPQVIDVQKIISIKPLSEDDSVRLNKTE